MQLEYAQVERQPCAGRKRAKPLSMSVACKKRAREAKIDDKSSQKVINLARNLQKVEQQLQEAERAHAHAAH
jgi:hypothetical protein